MAKPRKPRSKAPKRAIRGGGKKGPGAKRVPKKREDATPRLFGSLRGVVTANEKFFEPLPVEELDAWEK